MGCLKSEEGRGEVEEASKGKRKCCGIEMASAAKNLYRRKEKELSLAAEHRLSPPREEGDSKGGHEKTRFYVPFKGTEDRPPREMDLAALEDQEPHCYERGEGGGWQESYRKKTGRSNESAKLENILQPQQARSLLLHPQRTLLHWGTGRPKGKLDLTTIRRLTREGHLFHCWAQGAQLYASRETAPRFTEKTITREKGEKKEMQGG